MRHPHREYHMWGQKRAAKWVEKVNSQSNAQLRLLLTELPAHAPAMADLFGRALLQHVVAGVHEARHEVAADLAVGFGNAPPAVGERPIRRSRDPR
jgi:hypothetical protein